jgi:RNA-binding protein
MKELRKQAALLKPIVRIGKNGLTEAMITEIKRMLKKKKLIKIKVLKNCSASVDAIRSQCIEETGAELIQKIGLTFTLWKK